MTISEEDSAMIGMAIARQNQIDYEEAGPKAFHGGIVYKGVSLSSRYDVAAEYVVMRSAVDAIPEILARRLLSIFCDSKACAAYHVEVKGGLLVDVLPDAVFEAFSQQGGFNVLEVLHSGQSVLLETGYWPNELDY